MNEEEMKEVLLLKSEIIEREKQYSNLYKDLCDKQKKEIKRLKEIEQAHKEENGKLRVELEKEKNKNKVIEIFRKDMPKDTEIICMRKEDFERNFKSDYISKDKIREKIKELKNKIDSDDYWMYTERDYIGMQYQIEILEELLEEK